MCLGCGVFACVCVCVCRGPGEKGRVRGGAGAGGCSAQAGNCMSASSRPGRLLEGPPEWWGHSRSRKARVSNRRMLPAYAGLMARYSVALGRWLKYSGLDTGPVYCSTEGAAEGASTGLGQMPARHRGAVAALPLGWSSCRRGAPAAHGRTHTHKRCAAAAARKL